MAIPPRKLIAWRYFGLTGLFVAPFIGLVGTPASGGIVLEVNTLIAMAIYALFVWLIVRLIPLVVDRPSARRRPAASVPPTSPRAAKRASDRSAGQTPSFIGFEPDGSIRTPRR